MPTRDNVTSHIGDGKKSVNRTVDLLSRERDSISRILSQAEFKNTIERLEELKSKIDSIESKLSGAT
jgi:hypothetical protein